MTSARLANPCRSTLASLDRGSELATCAEQGCHNVAVTVLHSAPGRQLVCRAHATR